MLEDHTRLQITSPHRPTESPEELTEDLSSLVHAYLKGASNDEPEITSVT
jgi:hypothetical protein